jgi:transcription termination/antitermination protein NusA
MELNLNNVIADISKEKGISQDVLIEALEAAILAAARKVFGQNRQLEARYSKEVGQVELFQYMLVVEDVEDNELEISLDQAQAVDPDALVGDELGFQIFYSPMDQDRAREEEEMYGDILDISNLRSTFGRIAAQTAKQVINQRVRSAERELIFSEYKNRKHELVTGIARRFERGDIIVDLGKAEAILPLREQVQKESYRAGDRVQAFVLDVLDSEHSVKGSQVVLSRRHPFMVMKLFEMEVPEIYESIVKIVSVAREPGERTKIAVTSTDSDVDPVGACVGMRGARVQAVVQELKGEKIDIVPYSPDLARFVCNAIAPAEVARVLIDEDTNTIELIVPDDQLSLAIGRRGQNVKLASQLVGWNIEIHSESQIAELKSGILNALTGANVMDPMDIEYMFKLGLHSVENILGTPDEELLSLPGISEETIPALREVLEELQEQRIRQAEEDRRARDAALHQPVPPPEAIPEENDTPAPEDSPEEESDKDVGEEDDVEESDDTETVTEETENILSADLLDSEEDEDNEPVVPAVLVSMPEPEVEEGAAPPTPDEDEDKELDGE